MSDELTQVAVEAGKNVDVVDKLDQLLNGPNDRAYIVCSLTDCELNLKGRCTIYAVLDVQPMKTVRPCDKYVHQGSRSEEVTS